MPAGASLSSSCVLSGTLTQSGTYPITVTASNGVAPSATVSFTFHVGVAPAISAPERSTTVAIGQAMAPLDVLVAHEAPAGMEPPSLFKLAPQTDERARLTRARILRAMRRTHPTLVLHGHWHLRRSAVVEDHDGHVFRIEGLASDEEANGTSWGVLDLATLELRDGTELGGA